MEGGAVALRGGGQFAIEDEAQRAEAWVVLTPPLVELMLVVRTDPADRTRGLSILMVETEGRPGYRVGRVLDKLGLTAQDTAELYFTDCRIPKENRLGEKGTGFLKLMQQLQPERIRIE